MQPNSPRNGGPGSSMVPSQLSNNGSGGLGISPSSAINSSVGPGASAKTMVSSSGTISLQPSVILPAPPPLPSMGGIGRGMSQLTPSSGPTIPGRIEPPNINLRQGLQTQSQQPQTAVSNYSATTNPYTSSSAHLQSSSSVPAAPTVTTTAQGRTSVVTAVHETFHRIVFTSTAKFFGVHAETEESARATWNERRRRLAIKRFGGVKDEYLSSQHHQYNAGGPEGSAVPSNPAGGNNTNMSGGAPSSGMGGGGYGTHHFTPQVRNKLGLHLQMCQNS